MDLLNLTTLQGRLALVDQVFTYPKAPHQRKHGPQGYENYESYRDWIRDEFSYRCVFSLFRETWPSVSFHLDHLIPQQTRPDLVCDYENLILMESQSNLAKGKKPLPDPCKVDLSLCVFVHVTEERLGEIEALNADGRRIVNTLRLNGPQATGNRQSILRILRSLAHTDESTFRKMMGYPNNLPDLKKLRPPNGNSKPEGIEASCLARRVRGELPETY